MPDEYTAESVDADLNGGAPPGQPGSAEDTTQADQPTSTRDALAAAFAAGDDPTDTTQPAGSGGSAASGEEASGAEPDAEPLEPPHHWPADVQERFRNLSREDQQWFLDRDKGMTAQYTKQTQELKPLKDAFERYAPYAQQLGLTPEMLYDQAMQTVATLRSAAPEQQVQMLFQVADSFNIPWREALGLNQQRVPTDADGNPDPTAQAIQQAVQPLYQQVSQMQQGWQQQQQQQSQASMQQIVDRLDAFANEKTEDGQLAHPYFDEVQPEMVLIVNDEIAKFGRVQSTDQQLYDKACRVNDSVNAKLQAAQRAAAAKQQRHDNRQQANRARQAGVSVGPGAAGARPPATDGSLRGSIAAAYDQLAEG